MSADAEPGVNDLMSVAEALGVIDAAAVSPREVDVPLDRAAGLCLAADLHADRDFPPFEKSVMDGYAVRSADAGSVGAVLRCVGEVAAGAAPGRAVGAGEAVAIMTGAPLPAGADAVVPVEHVVREADAVRIARAPAAGNAIARQGSDVARGSLVLPRGTRIGAAQIAVAAGIGAATVRCYAKPLVAVLGTGDEIVPVNAMPGPHQIRSSNNPMLVALLTRLGCDVNDRGICPDEPAKIRAAIESGLAGADALFVTGGMSMGAYDYVPKILREMGADLRVTKLRLRPGKPFVFAAMPGGKYVFGLPGNPVSAFVCTLRLASRLLTRQAGGEVTEPLFPAAVTDPLPANGPREFYQPALLEGGAVRPLAWKGSADLFTLARANALIVRPENAAPVPAGGTVHVLEIPS